jgi:RNA polymerase sigma factor (sigma-70 family)
MSIAPQSRIREHLRQLLEVQCSKSLTDGALLDRFTAAADQVAFGQLVGRHGPMVLSACRRVLGHSADADDAFQAAFLLLARKAASIRQRDSIASWLFAVARRLALHARAGIQRRSLHECQVPDMDQTGAVCASEIGDQELRAILDEELCRLPEKYRTPLVLCYLEGLSRAEAARQLGCKPGAVKIRLERGRNRLRARLLRRGLATSAGLVGALLNQTASAHVSATMIRSTTQAATAYAAGAGLFTGLVPERALALVEGMRKAMLLSKLKIVTIALFTMGLLAGGVASLLQPSAVAQPAPATAAAPAPAGEKASDIGVIGETLPTGARARLGTTCFLHESDVAFAAYTADGKHLITSTQKGAVRLWNAASGKEVRQFLKPTEPAGIGGNRMPVFPAVVALSPDGKTLATVPSPGNVLTLWEIESGKQIGQWKSASAMAILVFAPDGKSLFSKDGDGFVRHRDLEGKELHRYGEKPKNPWGGGGNRSGLAVSSDGKTVATTGFDAQVFYELKRWDVATGKDLLAKSKAERGGLPIFSPDGKTFAWTNIFKVTLSVRDMESDKELRQLDGTWMRFSADSKRAAVRGKDNGLTVYDLENGKELHKLVAGTHDGPVQAGGFSGYAPEMAAAFSTDGKKLVYGMGNRVRQWDVTSGKEIVVADGHAGAVASVALSADGKTAFSRGTDSTLRRWDVATGKQQQQAALPARAFHTAFSADGRTLALSGEGNVWICDTRTGKVTKEWQAHDKALVGLAITADGKRVATRSYDRSIRIWDSQSGKKIREMADLAEAPNMSAPGAAIGAASPDSDLMRLAFSPRGDVLAALPPTRPAFTFNGMWGQQPVLKDYAIYLWDVETGKSAGRFDEAKTPIYSSAFSADGRTIATAHADSTISLWEVLSGKPYGQFKTGGQPITTLAFTPNGKVLVGGGIDGAIRFWEADTGKELAVRKGHIRGILSLAIAADGKSLASGSSDSTGLVWDMPELALGKTSVTELDGKQVEAHWAELADADPAKTRTALQALIATPKQAVTLLREQLKPVAAADDKQVAQWIADLESDDFAVRKKAEDNLTERSELVQSALRTALAKPNFSLEARRRMERIIEQSVGVRLPGPRLRELRSVAVLEEIATADARELLGKLARGAADARLTRDARAAQDRLTTR